MTDNRNIKILLVDDNPINIKILETALVKEGYETISANDGVHARKLASEGKPDLILLDIMMPGEDGFQVIKQLKTDSGTASIPVIFLTGKEELNDKIRGFDLGAVDYITKPFYVQEVLARVRLHLKLSIATNSLISSQAERLRQVKDAQESILVKPAEIPDACFSVYFRALLEAGGDFYDVLKISEHIFGYFIADVSGHDIATSYITAAVKALLKQNCTPVYEPVESIKMINDVLVEILPGGKYLTSCYAKLNRKAKIMTIINCGHPPVIYLPKMGSPEFIDIRGDVLGIFKDVYFAHKDIRVNEGDRFFLYSDGLIERAGEKKVWTNGLEKLLERCNLLNGIPIGESADKLMDLMAGPGVRLEDDIVIMSVEV